MEKVPDLLAADSRALERRFGLPGPRKDFVLQLGGNDPNDLRKCIHKLSFHGYSFREINLNCGCPSIESGGASLFGASLMKDPTLTGDLLAAISDATGGDKTVVSLKCRTAVFEDIEEMQQNWNEERSYLRLIDYISEAERGGISHLVLHARPAILSGLSPTKNRQVPPIDYNVVEKIASAFPSLDVTLNGGIANMMQLESRLHHTEDDPKPVDSFMAGRWMLRRPLDMAMVQLRMEGPIEQKAERNSKAKAIALEAIKNYASFLLATTHGRADSTLSFDEMCLPLFLVAEQVRVDYESDEIEESQLGWLDGETLEEIFDSIAETIQRLEEMRKSKSTSFSSSSLEFNRLAKSFETLVGKKIVNKWKRNRSEL
eukprot:CAMPEP_0176012992 /NCGR_PEP_ID=MMETSP0120_2-20121206/6079_1 /TAXON_ID=160619 /ORGANISM="Kryptoperidinium foliaceum, Strain CCMP 1326" /LENGTH=372 /DNA_ID=CAMNT_0017345891 /DNA_START=409 /DNA_END=1527 /DNA_ORIENTATION=+